ncbi:MAG TPA: alkaline phosphatase family protein [Bryobacteraceae bacterium]|jgi:predicted AlkP superfamily phosphohydrolase/phosphomutase|nr:alkaline phosphatase family protein [Bryobacteraceae bacterium]
MRDRLWVVVLAAAASLAGCHGSQAHGRQVIVLGVDAMDPNFLERHWSELPNVAHLRAQGGFRRLATTMPPQSPVAWSTFITGWDPAQHGIFDFVHRDPHTMQPFSSMARVVDPRFQIPLGPFVLPLSSARVETLRRGEPFWRMLWDRHIPVTIMHMPTNFPPEQAGQAIAGMGVPDLRGTEGTFTFYTDDPEEAAREVPGGRIVNVHAVNGRYELPLEGPPNSLRRDRRFAAENLIVEADPERDVARVTLGSTAVIVQQGEWSEWLRADFPLLGWLAGARGMVRVYAKEFHPRLALYVTPVNMDPRAPELPISAPASYSRAVAGAIGPFYTQGIAEDTSAYRQGVLNLEEFLHQSTLVRNDEMKLLGYSLDHFREGLLFFYFSSIDQASHMLWGKHEAELLEVYRAIDGAIGEVARRFPHAEIMVMSDHGFTSFDRAVNLNTWLWEKGFLALTGPPRGGDEGFSDVDWSKTQAYAMGLNGLYLNIAGRERQGILQTGAQADAVIGKLARELTGFRDPVNGHQVVEVAPATGVRMGPDIIVGYGRGYRASWQTALGGAPPAILEDNTDAWIGDHCINPADVPGVLLSNRALRAERPSLKDVTVTVLGIFGVGAGPGMTGRNVF